MNSKIIRIGGILYILNANIYLLFEFLTVYATRCRFKGSKIKIYRFLSILFSFIGFIFSYLFIISIALGDLKLTPIYEKILVYSLIILEYITGI